MIYIGSCTFSATHPLTGAVQQLLNSPQRALPLQVHTGARLRDQLLHAGALHGDGRQRDQACGRWQPRAEECAAQKNPAAAKLVWLC